MANIILVEGPDNSGKTTLIEDICTKHLDSHIHLDFPKRTDSGRFTIETRNEVACFETMLKYIDPRYVYVLDRGYLSNIVYGELRAMNKTEKEQVDIYRQDLERLMLNHNVTIIGLTRNQLEVEFEDDLISLSNGGFNKVISLFEKEYQRLGVEPVQILNHDGKNNIISVNK